VPLVVAADLAAEAEVSVKGKALRIKVKLTLEEIANGVERKK
jgi:hypothetical protein